MPQHRFPRRSPRLLLGLSAFLLTFGAGGCGYGQNVVPVAPIVVPPAELPRPAHPEMGVNLEQLVDYAQSQPFVDVMKSARTFGSADAPWDEKAPVDKDGWPTGDAGTVVMADVPVPPGQYRFSCTGRCTVGVLSGGGSLQGQGYDRTSNTTSAIINVAPNATSFYINFKNTSGGVKNIKLLRPGFRPGAKEVFSKEFLSSIAPFSTLRLMDFTHTNSNDCVNWDDRTKPTDALQSSKRGAAWEYGIMLANQTKKDLWVNVPGGATDDYVRQLAKLLKDNLDPDRVVYVEYSNEVWNTIFNQFHQNLDAAKAQVAASGGKDPLNDFGADNNEYYWGWKRISQRCVQISNIFKEVYGPDAINTRVRPVLASQAANALMIRTQVDYIARTYGPPEKFIYGIAGAPYMGLDGKYTNQDTLTVDFIFDTAVPDTMVWVHNCTKAYQVLARYYRLHNMCYEGGMGIEGEHSLKAKMAANRDPRVTQILGGYFHDWYALGGDLFMYYNLAGTYGKFGNWGLMENIGKPTVKWKTAVAAIEGPTPPESAGHVLPAVVQAVDADARDGGGIEKGVDGAPYIAYLRDPNSFDFLLNVPAGGGIYAVSLQTASPNADGRIDLSLSSTPLGTVEAPNTGAYTSFGFTKPVLVQLEPGELVLRVKVAHSGMNVKAVRIERRGDIPADAKHAAPEVAGGNPATQPATAAATAPATAPAQP